MRVLFSRMVAATIFVAASAVGWKAEAATVIRCRTLPLQIRSYISVEKTAYWRRHFAVPIGVAIAAMATPITAMGTTGPTAITVMAGDRA